MAGLRIGSEVRPLPNFDCRWHGCACAALAGISKDIPKNKGPPVARSGAGAPSPPWQGVREAVGFGGGASAW